MRRAMIEPDPKPTSLDRMLEQMRSETDMQRRMRHFAALVALNKTRRRRDGDPPAALPVPAQPRGRGPFLKGGAAAELVFEDR